MIPKPREPPLPDARVLQAVQLSALRTCSHPGVIEAPLLGTSAPFTLWAGTCKGDVLTNFLPRRHWNESSARACTVQGARHACPEAQFHSKAEQPRFLHALDELMSAET